MFSVLSGHSLQPPADSRHGMMEGSSCAALPTAENHLLDPRPDLEKRLGNTFAVPKSYFKSFPNHNGHP